MATKGCQPSWNAAFDDYSEGKEVTKQESRLPAAGTPLPWLHVSLSRPGMLSGWLAWLVDLSVQLCLRGGARSDLHGVAACVLALSGV